MTGPQSLTRAEFVSRLAEASPIGEPPAQTSEALYEHYRELVRWGARIDLVGPGAWDELIERHYAESLAAVAHLPASATVVDLGSGAGFPGWVLATARPDLEVILVEARARKCAFLAAASRRAGIRCRIVNARVEADLPPDLPRRFAAVTARAIRLSARALSALREGLTPGGGLIFWTGEEPPAMPRGWKEVSKERLPSGANRYLRRFVPEPES